ncbi:hypothetical protein [Formosa sp. L2A11]|uniref:hypothetical protein n=1 Tax=Formosa sp. L2A11 TaxID=2686363 RepID=UPI00131C1936|nr:hypothetical protein [Formosa sp. L2A11]
MKKILFLCLFIALSINTIQAHNPLSAAYYLEVKENLGILNVSLSQVGFQEALVKHYSDLDLDALSNDEYKMLAVKYIKEHFKLEINGEDVVLLNGGLKLGNHQTDLKFITSKLPEVFKTLDLNINAFTENEHHQTIFSLLLNENTSKVILSEKNNYSASMSFQNSKMIAKGKRTITRYLWILAIVIPVVLVGKKLMFSRRIK